MYFFIIFVSNFFVQIYSEEISNENLKSNLNECGNKVISNKLCYLEELSDDIAHMKEKMLRYSEHTIFFIDNSCRGGLNFHEACTVEAAARAHPHREVVILFVGPVSRHCLNISPLSELLRFSNVKILRLNVTTFYKNTPLQILVAREAYNKNISPVYHTTDVLKYVTLHKFGGIFLDLDVMVVKPLDFLPQPSNWAVKEGSFISPSYLALSRHGVGRKISYNILRLLKDTFGNGARRHSSVLQDVLQKICKTKDVRRMYGTVCQGFTVYNSSYFYGIDLQDRDSYFAKHNGEAPTDVFAFRFWNHISLDDTIYNDSLYAERTKEHCPYIHEVMIIYDTAK